MRNNLLYGYISLLLIFLQVVLVVVSWLVSAAMPYLPVRSLLSSGGIRWFFGHFVDNLMTPFLVWGILLAIAYGSFVKGGLRDRLFYPERMYDRHHSSRSKTALYIVCAELFFFVMVILLLTVVPHAVLLSVTGSLFPSYFSDSLIPILAFIVTVCSITYGTVAGILRSLKDVYSVLTTGIHIFAPLFPIYVLVAQLYASFIYVF